LKMAARLQTVANACGIPRKNLDLPIRTAIRIAASH
jgi:hypothetical protein